MPLKVKKVRSGVRTDRNKPNPSKQHQSHTNHQALSSPIETEDAIHLLNNVSEDSNNNINETVSIECENVLNNVKDSSKNLGNCNLKHKIKESESSDDNQVLLVGDLIWSKIPGHFWWPSMISYDPCQAIYFTKSKNGKDASKFHVQFFGDKSLRGWVSKSNTIEYKGKEHFLSLPFKLLKTKSPSPKQVSSWENAIKQADKALHVNRKERILKFMYSYDEPTVKHQKTNNGKNENIEFVGNNEKQSTKKINCKDVLKEVESETKNTIIENNSDSGIEDSASCVDNGEDKGEKIKEINKRQRKQKVYQDFHTGLEMNLAIKSTTWKPMPILNKTLSPPKRQADSNLLQTETLTAQEKEIKTSKKKRSNKNAQNDTTDETITDKEGIRFTNIDDKIELISRKNNRKTNRNEMAFTLDENVIDEKNGKVKRDDRAMFCSLCEETNGDLVPCSGQCFRYFHVDCLGLGIKPKFKFVCDECQTGHHMCFLCKEAGDLIKCSQVTCGKFFHSYCIDKLQEPESKSSNGGSRFFCPHHSCKVCCNQAKASSGTTSVSLKSASKLVKCIRCPTAYHQRSCFIAGCQVITPQYMICDQHYEVNKSRKHNHVNVTWCFVCSHGGSLVCCDTCPASFHPECTSDLQGIPEGAWRCKDCKEHNKPKYGEIVWVKFGVYRWWPGQICFPEEIPERIQQLSHSLGEFPVMFFGSRDYSWIHSGRVFRYEEGDKGGTLKKTNSLGKYFTKALEEAKVAHEEIKKEQAQLSESMDKKKSRKPPPYKSIKVNRPVNCIRTVLDQSEWPICDCSGKDGCTAESECLNRMLYFECNSKTCKAGTACHNQRMQRFQSKDLKPFKCEGKGWGLKAEQDIRAGDFVVEYVGELIDEETCQQRVKEYHEKEISDYYFLTIDKDNIIDAYPKGNLSRFMNHSCDPNCETQKWTVNGEVRVGLFASRDIKHGDELCFNYHLDSLGNEKKQCKCGSGNCSGYLGVKPKTQHAMSVAEKAKNKKKKEKERRKLKKQKMQKLVHEDDCFVCGDGGDLILCSRGKCTKAYHLKCLALEKIPYGKWECPWHFCDECGKTAKVMCALCTNSYCMKHQEGEMFPLRENVTVCSQHSEEEFKEFLMALENQVRENTVPEISDASEMDGNNDDDNSDIDKKLPNEITDKPPKDNIENTKLKESQPKIKPNDRRRKRTTDDDDEIPQKKKKIKIAKEKENVKMIVKITKGGKKSRQVKK